MNARVSQSVSQSARGGVHCVQIRSLPLSSANRPRPTHTSKPNLTPSPFTTLPLPPCYTPLTRNPRNSYSWRTFRWWYSMRLTTRRKATISHVSWRYTSPSIPGWARDQTTLHATTFTPIFLLVYNPNLLPPPPSAFHPEAASLYIASLTLLQPPPTQGTSQDTRSFGNACRASGDRGGDGHAPR